MMQVETLRLKCEEFMKNLTHELQEHQKAKHVDEQKAQIDALQAEVKNLEFQLEKASQGTKCNVESPVTEVQKPENSK